MSSVKVLLCLVFRTPLLESWRYRQIGLVDSSGALSEDPEWPRCNKMGD